MLRRDKGKKKKLLTAGIISCVIALVLAGFLSHKPSYAAEPDTYTIGDSAALIEYATQYAAGNRNPNDTLLINLKTSTATAFKVSTANGFVSIGNSTNPFSGKVIFDTQAVDIIVLDAPLFGVVTTDLRIVYNDGTADRNKVVQLARSANVANQPLFANEVRAGTNAADWSINLLTDIYTSEDETTAHPFAGVIGTIGDGAVVKVSFVHDSVFSDADNVIHTAQCERSATSGMSGTPDIGLICWDLGEGASLTATASLGENMAGQEFTVTSYGGNAGGIVGNMQDGSQVKLVNGYSSICNVTTTNGFAGGIAGSALNATVTAEDPSNDETFNVTKTVTGTQGAGGIYGSYVCTETSSEIDVKSFTSDSSFVLAGGTNVGGVCGKLTVTGTAGSPVSFTVKDSSVSDVTAVSSINREVTFTGGANRGGLIGGYESNLLKNTLVVNNVTVQVDGSTGTSTTSGGAIGAILDGTGQNAAYVYFDGFRVDNAGENEIFAGAVGTMGGKGSFVDFHNEYQVNGKVRSGLVDDMSHGVIRLQGLSDLSGAIYTSADSNKHPAQLVRKRGNGLIYAVGTGADTASVADGNWTFRRGTGYYDDIDDWGEVFRLNDSAGSNDYDFAETDFFNVDDSVEHTVTVYKAVQNGSDVADIDSLEKFIKVALNMQMNSDGANSALKFESGSLTSAQLLGKDITLAADIDLSHTGIISLMKDDGSQNGYSGTFDGGANTVSLAAGEPYGVITENSADVLLDQSNIGNNNYGTIFFHKCIGLLAKTSNATVQNLSVDGFMSVSTANGTYNIGGVTGTAGGTGSPLTLKKVTTAQDILLYQEKYSGNSAQTGNISMNVNCGGAVGSIISGTTGTVTIGDASNKCVFDNDILELKLDGATSRIGGAIGNIAATGSLTVNVNTVDLSGTYDNNNDSRVSASDSFGGLHYGGLIGSIASNSGSFSRNVSIKNLTVKNDVGINSKISDDKARTAGAGAFIGHDWLDTNVTIGTSIGSTDGITIGESASSAPSITVPSGSKNVNVGALVYKASGHWAVNHLDIDKMSVSSGIASSTLGIIVNDGCASSSSLYLDLYMPGYTIDDSNSNVSIGSNFTTFDEVVAYSAFSNKSIYENGQAIVSIRTAQTDPTLTMDGSDCNTYQNQTYYGKNTVKSNQNTRYYYNLDYIRDHEASASDAENMLLWSLKQYAANSIKNNGYFNGSYSISGNCDMEGLSYYPVIVNKSATDTAFSISNTTVKFHNQGIEDSEAAGPSSGSDSYARSTRTTSSSPSVTQHYLMHEGIFYNFTGPLSISNLTLKGDVSNQHTAFTGSGFIVCNTLGGDPNNLTNVTITTLTLSGAKIDRGTSGDYAPLIINKIGQNTSVNISTVTTTGNSTGSDAYNSSNTVVAASSLMGEVGSADATNINLFFSDMRLDARTKNVSNVNGVLNTAYQTSRAIFDRSTFLESFRYASDSIAEYNYTHAEDWNGSTPLHHVTYGKEISSSTEYSGEENHYIDYYGQSDHFTSPASYNAGSAYSFLNNFLPHVKVAYDADTKYHEVKVNVKAYDLDNGCGQYNHPYYINEGGMLATAAKIISGAMSTTDAGIKVVLPLELGSSACLEDNTLDMWCTDRTSCAEYEWNGTSFVYNDTSKSLEDVRKYLAGAYYQITQNIDLPPSYIGLGSVTYNADGTQWIDEEEYECAYAFHGVIVSETGEFNKITNKSSSPLIKNSNGCVVKDVLVSCEPLTNSSISLNQKVNKTFSYASTGCDSYGLVIGKVMGGDNIIDGVGVDFSNGNAKITVNGKDNYQRLISVGGYVGVAVSGGVIFRNMTTSNTNLYSEGTKDYRVGLTTDNVKNSRFVESYLYINQLIGRVVSAYVFNEASTYAVSSASLNNGTKNYVIPDVVPGSANKLVVNADSETNHTITVPDAQSLYILSCVVNSGAGGAAYNSTSTGNYSSSLTSVYNAYRSYTQTRCASYDQVGSATSTDYTSKVSVYDTYNSASSVPYVVRQYTKDTSDSGKYFARSICGSNTRVASITLTSTGTYNLPQGYRGIGNIYDSADAFKLQFKDFHGTSATVDGNQVESTVNLQMSYSDYSGTKDFENCPSFEPTGFGLFNKVFNVPSTGDSIHDFTLTGSINYFVYTNGGGTPDYSSIGKNQTNILSVGGVAGYTDYSIRIKNVTLDTFTVNGIRNSGGLVGWINNARNTTEIIDCGTPDASKDFSKALSVSSWIKTGGFVGYISNSSGYGTVDIYGTGGDTVVYLKQILGKYNKAETSKVGGYSRDNRHFEVCCGGIIGKIKGSKEANISNISIIGANDSDYCVKTNAPSLQTYDSAGGIIGCAHAIGNLTVSGLTLKKIDVLGSMGGGIVGYLFQETVKGNHRVVNTSIDGLISEGNYASVSAYRCAGAYFGRIQKKISDDFIVNVYLGEIENLNIISLTTDPGDSPNWRNESCVGSVIGSFNCVTSTSNNKKAYIDIYDFRVDNCNLETRYKNSTKTPLFSGVGVSASTNTNYDQEVLQNGAGGLIGSICSEQSTHTNDTYRVAVYGHNILLNRININHYDNGGSEPDEDCDVNGLICGNNLTLSPIKIVGISLQNFDELPHLSGWYYAESGKDYLGGLLDENGKNTIGYTVFADFNGKSLETDNHKNTDFPTYDKFDSDVPLYSIANGTATVDSTGGTYVECDLTTTAKINGTGDDKYFFYAGTSYASITPRYDIADGSATLNNLTGTFVECYSATLSSNTKYFRLAAPASPYVTVNGSAYIGTDTLFLTGDAAASSVDDIPLEDIFDDNRYAFSVNNVSEYTAIFKTYAEYEPKISTFDAEQGSNFGANGKDFVVLVLDDTNKLNSTALVNNYIRLLTNTDIKYSDNNKPAVYSIEIKRMKYNGSGFVIDTSADPNLKMSNSQFYMESSSPDTEVDPTYDHGVLFSLIDVKYYDPADTTKVAYHLYVPVIVRKMLKYDFKVATGTSTVYYSTWYSDNNRFGKSIIENLGSPETLYFEYDYVRTKSELQSVINSGESLLRNYSKNLVFTKQEAAGVVIPAGTVVDWPSDTILVLVDANRGGMPYYSTFGDAYNSVSGVLELGEFTSADGTPFTPVQFNDMISLKEVSGSTYKKFASGEDTSTATVKIGDDYYKPVESGGTCAIELDYNNLGDSDRVPLKESYYLTFFTKKPANEDDAVFCHYMATAPNGFDESEYPSKMRNRGAGEDGAHVYTANVFVQSEQSMVPGNDKSVITAYDNDTLTATMTTKISLINNSYIRTVFTNTIEDNTTSDIQVYQSFIVNLTRLDELDGGGYSSRKIIAGDPSSGDPNLYYSDKNGVRTYSKYRVYYPGDNPDLIPWNNYLTTAINGNNNYAEYVTRSDLLSPQVSLNRYLKNGGEVVIESQIVIQYEGVSTISDQFPARKGKAAEVAGVKMSGYSNIGFDPGLTAFSNSSVELPVAPAVDYTYYRLVDDNSATLYYNVVPDAFGGDYGNLGINPLDSNDQTEVDVSTIGVLDISEIFDDVVGTRTVGADTERYFEYDTVKCYIRLYNKGGLTQSAYGNPLVLSNYITNLTLTGVTYTTAAAEGEGGTRAVFYFPITEVNDTLLNDENDPNQTSPNPNIVIPIDFKVKTGGPFETAGYFYSNYKVELEVELVKSTDHENRLQNSNDKNYIIYTNARLLPDYTIFN